MLKQITAEETVQVLYCLAFLPAVIGYSLRCTSSPLGEGRRGCILGQKLLVQKVPGRDRTLYKAAQGDSSIQIIECNVTIYSLWPVMVNIKMTSKRRVVFHSVSRKERGEKKKKKKKKKKTENKYVDQLRNGQQKRWVGGWVGEQHLHFGCATTNYMHNIYTLIIIEEEILPVAQKQNTKRCRMTCALDVLLPGVRNSLLHIIPLLYLPLYTYIY